jgi:hypothetical protein
MTHLVILLFDQSVFFMMFKNWQYICILDVTLSHYLFYYLGYESCHSNMEIEKPGYS